MAIDSEARPSPSSKPSYNFLPEPFPRNLSNPSLYAGRSSRPIPLDLSLPQRWQRGAQFMAVSLSLGCGVWGVLFADFGNNDRETVFSPIRRWFAPYKAMFLNPDEHDRKVTLVGSTDAHMTKTP